jgi:hypothetical protein
MICLDLPTCAVQKIFGSEDEVAANLANDFIYRVLTFHRSAVAFAE